MTMTQRHGEWIRVAALSEFDVARRLVREVGGTSVLLCRLGGDVVAVENVCTHLRLPLADGRIMAGQITCPHHNACFDLRTGEAISGPAVRALRIWPVRINDGDVQLLIPPSDNPSVICRSGG